jgi:WD40 repeat protein
LLIERNRLFEPVTLKYAGILPKPHPLGTDISIITSPDMVRSTDKSTFYPDAVAMVYDGKSQRVTVVYSDRSLYVWDIRDLQKIGKYRSFIFHSDCVWGVEVNMIMY